MTRTRNALHREANLIGASWRAVNVHRCDDVALYAFRNQRNVDKCEANAGKWGHEMANRKETKPLTVRLDSELYQTLSDVAQLNQVSLREVVQAAIEVEIQRRLDLAGDSGKKVLTTMRQYRQQILSA